jgi:hypothetical protein
VLAVALPEVLLDEWTPEQATEHMQTDATACVNGSRCVVDWHCMCRLHNAIVAQEVQHGHDF